MVLFKTPNITGKDFYRLIYKNDLDLEAEYSIRSAIAKVNSIDFLLNKNKIAPETMLELGCGTGAIISRCKERAMSARFFAVDYSQEAIAYLSEHFSAINSAVRDITKPWDQTFGEKNFDVVILSHVIEHLEKPAALLENLFTIPFSYLIIEVPLEDTIRGKFEEIFNARSTKNKAGHVQFYNAASFDKLITSAGFEIVDRIQYLPFLDIENARFVCKKDNLSKIRFYLMVVKWYLLKIFPVLGKLLEKFNYSHYAVLVRKATDLHNNSYKNNI